MRENSSGFRATSTFSDRDASLSRPSTGQSTHEQDIPSFFSGQTYLQMLTKSAQSGSKSSTSSTIPSHTKTPADADTDTDSDLPCDRTAGGGHAQPLSLTTAPTNLMCLTSTMETFTDRTPEPHPVVALQAATGIDRLSRNHIRDPIQSWCCKHR